MVEENLLYFVVVVLYNQKHLFKHTKLNTLKGEILLDMNCTLIFFNAHLRILLLIFEREEEGEGGEMREIERGTETETENHWCEKETSVGCLPYMP